MVLSRPRAGRVIRARDVDRVVRRVSRSMVASDSAIVGHGGAYGVTQGRNNVGLFEFPGQVWEAIVPSEGKPPVLAALAKPMRMINNQWVRLDGAKDVAIWWPQGGAWPEGYQVPLHVRKACAFFSDGVWILLSNSQPVFRVELRSAFSDGEAEARFVAANGTVLEDWSITVNDPFGIYIGGAYKHGYVVLMPDAQRLEVIQLEC